MNHRIGTVDLPPRIAPARYFAELDVLELSATHRAPLRPGAIARWKTDAPRGSLALAAPWVVTHRKPPPEARGWVADDGSGELRDSPAVRAALRDFSATVAELAPWAVVFASPPLFSPSSANRDRLERFFAEVAPAELFGGAQRVWIPDGLWEPLAAVRFAQQLGVTCAVDPLVIAPGAPPDQHLHYEVDEITFRISALGRTRGLREDDLLTIEELSAYYPSAAFLLASMERWKDAKNIAKRLSEEATAVDPMLGGRRKPGQELAFQRPSHLAGLGAAVEVDELAVTNDLSLDSDDDDLDEDDLDEDLDDDDLDEDDLDEDLDDEDLDDADGPGDPDNEDTQDRD